MDFARGRERKYAKNDSILENDRYGQRVGIHFLYIYDMRLAKIVPEELLLLCYDCSVGTWENVSQYPEHLTCANALV